MLDLLDFIDPNQHEAIFSGPGVYADDALEEAIAYGLSLGAIPAIELPAGRLKFARTVHLKHTVKLIGHGGGQATSWGKPATVFQFDPDQSGIVVHRYDTNDGVIEAPPTTAADGTIIEGIRLEGSGTVGHGISLKARAVVRDCQIDGFGGNGVHIVADTRSSDPDVHGNANGWLFDTLRVTQCKAHGVYLDGGDSNAGTGIGVDASANGGWGIFDSSFLGNTWLACHSANNALGAYKTDNPSARSVFVGCYSEGGQPLSEFSPSTLILGGLHGAGMTGGQWIGDGMMSPFTVPRGYGDRSVRYRYGKYSGFDVLAEGDHPNGWQLGWWCENSKTVQFRHAMLDSRWTMALTTNLSGLLDEAGTNIGPGQMVLNNVWAPSGSGRYRKIDLADMLKRIEVLEST